MTSDLPPPDPEEVPRRSRGRGPNYTARRVAVGSAALAVLAVAAVVVLTVTGGDDDGDGTAASPGWNTIVEVNRASGDLVVLDADGEELATIDGEGRVTEVHARNDRLALVGAGQVVLRGLDPETDPTVVALDRATSIVRHPSNRSLTLVAAPDIGGEIVIVDGETGSVIELGASAGQTSPLLLPESLRLDRSGSRFAVGDGRNFQTIMIDADPEVEPGFFPGVPMAVGAELVVTSTTVGRTAELGFFDVDGERLGLVTTDPPVGGVLEDDHFVYVTDDGTLFVASAADSSPTEIATLDIGDVTEVYAVFDGARLIVSSSSRHVVVGLDGNVFMNVDRTADSPLPGPPWHTWRCFPVPGDDASIFDLDTGELLLELDDRPIAAVSTNGCGVHQHDDDLHTITSPAGSHAPRGAVRSVVLAPDGSAAIVVATDGNAELVDLDDSRRLDLGTRRGHLVFAER
jgi:hypothetical protein